MKKLLKLSINLILWPVAIIVILFSILGVIDEWIVSIDWFKKAITWLF